MEAKKLQIEDVKRRFEESRKSVPAIEVDSDVVQGGSEGAGGAGGGVVGEEGFGVDLEGLSGLPNKGDGVEDAAEVLTSLTAGGSAESVGGGPAPQSAGEEEEEVLEKEAEPEQASKTGSRRSNKKKRGRPRKAKKVPKHLFIKKLTDDQEQDL